MNTDLFDERAIGFPIDFLVCFSFVFFGFSSVFLSFLDFSLDSLPDLSARLFVCCPVYPVILLVRFLVGFFVGHLVGLFVGHLFRLFVEHLVGCFVGHLVGLFVMFVVGFLARLIVGFGLLAEHIVVHVVESLSSR